MSKEVTIFDSDFCSYDEEEVKKELAEIREVDEAEITQEEIADEIHFQIETNYELTKEELDKTLDGRILAIARVGRWNGTFSGYKILGNNLNEILYFGSCDDIKVYADRDTIYSNMYHHDGTHHVEYRELREDTNYEVLLDKIYNDSFTRQDIYRYTKSLRKHIKKIYGV